MQLATSILAEGEITIVNPAIGKVVLAVLIIMALWGQKIGGKEK